MLTKNSLFAAAAMLAGLAFILPTVATAFDSQPLKPKTTVKKCKKGYYYSKKKKRCIRFRRKSSVEGSEDLYQQGRLLARTGHYEKALVVLSHANQDDPHVLNYTGYSYRKMGLLETGITYYNKALAIRPDFVLAREYLGEGYVAARKMDLAREQLTKIRFYCGETCTEYKVLSAVISGAPLTRHW